MYFFFYSSLAGSKSFLFLEYSKGEQFVETDDPLYPLSERNFNTDKSCILIILYFVLINIIAISIALANPPW